MLVKYYLVKATIPNVKPATAAAAVATAPAVSSLSWLTAEAEA